MSNVGWARSPWPAGACAERGFPRLLDPAEGLTDNSEEAADDIEAYVHANEGRWMMPTAVKMEVSPETIIRAVKGMKKSVRRAFMEDLIAATSPEYLQSIRDARRNFKSGKVKSHGEVFGR